jgi:hypothetical protein
MRKVAEELGRSKDANVAVMQANLRQAIDSVAAATQWLLDTFPGNPNAVAAVSVPYLKLWGTAAGGWQMARAALAAAAKLAASEGDAAFYRAKIAAALFYAEHILPQTQSLASAVISGAGSVLELPAEQF